jgi:signal transduction histidine kinase
MQQMEQVAGQSGTERRRVEAVVETLSSLRNKGESLAEVAHDTRNMVTALGLYCDLLEEPGVLAAPFSHYGSELRLVASASRRLVEKLVALDSRERPEGSAANGAAQEMESLSWTGMNAIRQPARRWDVMPAEPIDNLARGLLASRNLLAALIGSSIALTMDVEGGALPVRLTGEDLTRVLVNLMKNAAEAMPTGGKIRVGLRESPTEPGAAPWLTLTIEDNGPGMPRNVLEKVFEAGYTTRSKTVGANGNGGWPSAHRGLGLSITRSIVETAGGRINAANRDPAGACFQIELPVRTR